MNEMKMMLLECFQIYKKISFCIFYIPIKYNEYLVKKKVADIPEKIELYKNFAEDAFGKKKFFLAAIWYVTIYKKFGEEQFKSLKKTFYNPVKQYLFASFIAYTFRETCSDKDFLADKSYKALIRGNKKEAVHLFSLLSEKIFDDEKTCNLWINSFKCIANIYTNEKLVLSKEEKLKIENYVNGYKPFKKIITAGMGWSGSGAVFDFFKEFKKVYAVKGEACHIESKMGLYNLYKNRSYPIIFRKLLIRHFGLTLFGFGLFEDYNSYISSKHAKLLSLSNKKQTYAEEINFFCILLQHYYFENELDKDEFKILSDILLDTIAKTKGAKKGSIVVFDNIIHTYNIDTLEILDNTNFFCAFRDPRSNYVARVYEDKKFSKNIDSYILEYVRTKKRAEKKYEKLKNKKSKAHIISFEEFVLSEKYRNKLASLMGLDLSTQDKYKYFKPWESKKNVFIHESYDKSDEIKTIKNAIPEHCVDFDKIKQDLK